MSERKSIVVSVALGLRGEAFSPNANEFLSVLMLKNWKIPKQMIIFHNECAVFFIIVVFVVIVCAQTLGTTNAQMLDFVEPFEI